MNAPQRISSLPLSGQAHAAFPEFDCWEFSEKRHRYCVCVFVRDEGQRILDQLGKMQATAQDIDIIVADGGSTDGATSPENCKQRGVRALLVKKGPGRLGAQMRMAFAYALAQDYQGVIVVDGNDKDDVVGGLGRFIEKLDAGYDHVQGSRFIRGGLHRNTPLARLVGLKLLHAPLLAFASAFRYTDTTNGFRAYSRKLLTSDEVAPLRDVFEGYELHYHLSLEAAREGFRVVEVPVARVYPKTGRSPTKISPVGGSIQVLERLLAVIGGVYRTKDTLPGASLPERLLVELWRALPRAMRALRMGAERFPFLLRAALGIGLVGLGILSFFLHELGFQKIPSPSFTRAGFDVGCVGKAQPGRGGQRCATEAQPGRPIVFDDPRLEEFQEMTVELWFKPDRIGVEHVYAFGQGTGPGRVVYFSSQAPKSAQRGSYVGTAAVDGKWGREQILDAPVLEAGRWHHLVATLSWAEGRLASYLDGVPMTIGRIDTGRVRGNPLKALWIGSSPPERGTSFGEIGAVRVYDQYLEGRQVRSLYTGAAFSGPLSAKAHRVVTPLCFLAVIVLALFGVVHRRAGLVGLLLIMTGVLYISHSRNGLGLVNSPWFIQHQRDSEQLVFAGLIDGRPAGFHAAPTSYGLGELRGEDLSRYYSLPLRSLRAGPSEFIAYESQVGIGSTLLRGLRGLGELANRWDVGFLQTLSALITAGVLAFFCFSLGRCVSPIFGATIFVSLLASWWLTIFGRNLYWLPWLWFLPSLAVTAILGPRKWTSGLLVTTGICVALATFLKSLAGYEYLSAITIMACSMALVVREPQGLSLPIDLLRRFSLMIFIGLSSLAGFVGALLLHARMRGNGSILLGLKEILGRDAARRMAGDPSKFEPLLEESLTSNIAEVVHVYFDGQRIDGRYFVGMRFDTLAVAFVCLTFLWLLYLVVSLRQSAVDGRERPDVNRETRLFLLVVMGFVSSISWFVVAKAHSFVHRQMNFVLWTMFFVPALFGWAGEFFRTLLRAVSRWNNGPRRNP